MLFPTQTMGVFGKKTQAWLRSSPMWLSHPNRVEGRGRRERFAQTRLLRCIISQANASARGPLSSFCTCWIDAGFKFMEFYWQVGVSCLQKLSSIISVPWFCGQQLHWAETNQKHSSSFRKRAEFMPNFMMLFFLHCELCSLSDLVLCHFVHPVFRWLNQGVLSVYSRKKKKILPHCEQKAFC